MITKRVGLMACVAVLAAALSADAAPVLWNDFDGGDDGWTVGYDPGVAASASQTGTGGNPDGWLTLQADGGGGSPIVEFIANGGDLDTGGADDYSGLLSLRFDFYVDSANAGGPAALEAYFVGADSKLWSYNLTSLVSGEAAGWFHFNLNFYGTDVGDGAGAGAGWYGETDSTGAQADLLTALANVSEIGLRVGYGSLEGPGQIYGLDNFTLDNEYFVPEPGTWAALGFAFASLGITFRRRISDKIKEFRS